MPVVAANGLGGPGQGVGACGGGVSGGTEACWGDKMAASTCLGAFWGLAVSSYVAADVAVSAWNSYATWSRQHNSSDVALGWYGVAK